MTEEESYSQIKKFAGPGSGPRFKNFGTGAESESEKVTPATSDTHNITLCMREVGNFESQKFHFTRAHHACRD